METTRVDLVEEAKLRKLDTVQASLNGMWRSTLGGCPHRHGVRDSVDVCDANEMRPCIYEVREGSCELFQQILEEWMRELEICGECGQVRPDDEAIRGKHMTYICARCKKELELKTYGGYAVTEMENLCPECWEKYIEIKNRYSQELRRFWAHR